jgi:hypothetical protein
MGGILRLATNAISMVRHPEFKEYTLLTVTTKNLYGSQLNGRAGLWTVRRELWRVSRSSVRASVAAKGFTLKLPGSSRPVHLLPVAGGDAEADVVIPLLSAAD